MGQKEMRRNKIAEAFSKTAKTQLLELHKKLASELDSSEESLWTIDRYFCGWMTSLGDNFNLCDLTQEEASEMFEIENIYRAIFPVLSDEGENVSWDDFCQEVIPNIVGYREYKLVIEHAKVLSRRPKESGVVDLGMGTYTIL